MQNHESDFFPCPCCGHLVFRREPGSHEVCPICLWEDELAQLRFPLMPSISNGVSLSAAQQNYRRYGVAQHKNRGLARAPLEGERLDPDWRPLDPELDNIAERLREPRAARLVERHDIVSLLPQAAAEPVGVRRLPARLSPFQRDEYASHNEVSGVRFQVSGSRFEIWNFRFHI